MTTSTGTRGSYSQILVLLLVGLSCSDALRPSDVVGTYTLMTINGSPLPRLVVDDPGCQESVIGGSLVLEPDQSFQLELELVTACPTPTGPGEVFFTSTGDYRVDGADLVLRARADVAVEFDAEFIGNRLVVHDHPRYGDLGFAAEFPA
jgi:hypothetical protein